jgi:hypothetical protein
MAEYPSPRVREDLGDAPEIARGEDLRLHSEIGQIQCPGCPAKRPRVEQRVPFGNPLTRS